MMSFVPFLREVDLRDDLRSAHRHDPLAADRTMSFSDSCIEDAHIIIDACHRSDRRAGAAAGRFLLDGDRGGNSFDEIGIGLGKIAHLPARIGGERLDIAALPFGVDRVEGKRRLAGAGDARKDDELIRLEFEIDVLKVVYSNFF